MVKPGKVIHVDFNKGAKKPAPGFGIGPRFMVTIAAVALVAVVLMVALVDAAWLTSGFFAPTAIALAVLVALGARRLVIRLMINEMHRRVMAQNENSKKNEPKDRTLH